MVKRAYGGRKDSFTELEEATLERENEGPEVLPKNGKKQKDTLLQNTYKQVVVNRMNGTKLVVLRANVFPFCIYQTDLLQRSIKAFRKISTKRRDLIKTILNDVSC
jgi:hypothetical protein